MTASFQGAGNSPVTKEALSKLVINGANISPDCLRSHVGRGSDWHCLLADLFTMALTSSNDGGTNSLSSGPSYTIKVG